MSSLAKCRSPNSPNSSGSYTAIIQTPPHVRLPSPVQGLEEQDVSIIFGIKSKGFVHLGVIEIVENTMMGPTWHKQSFGRFKRT